MSEIAGLGIAILDLVLSNVSGGGAGPDSQQSLLLYCLEGIARYTNVLCPGSPAILALINIDENFARVGGLHLGDKVVGPYAYRFFALWGRHYVVNRGEDSPTHWAILGNSRREKLFVNDDDGPRVPIRFRPVPMARTYFPMIVVDGKTWTRNWSEEKDWRTVIARANQLRGPLPSHDRPQTLDSFIFSENGLYSAVLNEDTGLFSIKVASSNEEIWHSGSKQKTRLGDRWGEGTHSFHGGLKRTFAPFKLVLHGQDLGIYDAKNQGPIWTPHITRPKAQIPPGEHRVSMQDDGNFVMYDGRNRPVWSTGTSGGNRPPLCPGSQSRGVHHWLEFSEESRKA